MKQIKATDAVNYSKIIHVDDNYFVPVNDEDTASFLKANPNAVLVWCNTLCVKYHRENDLDTCNVFIFFNEGFHTYERRSGRLIDVDSKINPRLFPYCIFGRGCRLEVRIYPAGVNRFRIEPWELLPDDFIRSMPKQYMTTDELRGWLREEEVDLKIDSSLFLDATPTERAGFLHIIGELLK